MVMDSAVAEDLVQEAFAIAFAGRLSVLGGLGGPRDREPALHLDVALDILGRVIDPRRAGAETEPRVVTSYHAHDGATFDDHFACLDDHDAGMEASASVPS